MKTGWLITLALNGVLELFATSPVPATHIGNTTTFSIVHLSDTWNLAADYSATYAFTFAPHGQEFISGTSQHYMGRRKTPECESKVQSAGISLLLPSLKKFNRRTPPKKTLIGTPQLFSFFFSLNYHPLMRSFSRKNDNIF